MSEFDERLRRVVRTIGESAPHPPAVPDKQPAVGRRWNGPLVALSAFVVVVLVFGASRLLLWPEGGSSDGASGMEAVRHQVLKVTLTADLACDDAVGAGTSSLVIEAWADFDAGRFRQLSRFEDGSTRDRIVLGDMNYPTSTFAHGGSALILPKCGGDLLLGDPTSGPSVLFFNPPGNAPNVLGYRDLGSLVPGAFTDSLGRPSILYRQVIDGYATADDGTERPLRQVTEWHVDAETGSVLERVFSQTQAGRYDVRQTIVVTVDEVTEVDPASLSEVGYALEWSADDEHGPAVEATPIEPIVTLGTSALWPERPEREGSAALAERFAREVLGWRTPGVVVDPEAEPGAPTWVTVTDGEGGEIRLLATPVGANGWGVLQVGDPVGIAAGALGHATVTNGVPGSYRATIHATDSSGITYAWEADLTGDPARIVLPGMEAWSVRTLLITYHDEHGRITVAAGGWSGG